MNSCVYTMRGGGLGWVKGGSDYGCIRAPTLNLFVLNRTELEAHLMPHFIYMLGVFFICFLFFVAFFSFITKFNGCR